LKGQIALSLDSNTGLMLGLGKSLLMFDEIDTISSIYAEIDKITASQLLEIANRYFARDNCNELLFDLK
jgi:predicted Zn-dependent peptidase